jgi:hypothetical protein
LYFSIDLILPAAVWPLRSTQPLAEIIIRNLPGGKVWPALKADNLTAICDFPGRYVRRTAQGKATVQEPVKLMKPLRSQGECMSRPNICCVFRRRRRDDAF